MSDYADALGVDDKFVRVAHRYSQGAFGLAWIDLHQSGFAEHWESARCDQLKTELRLPDQLSPGVEDPALAVLGPDVIDDEFVVAHADALVTMFLVPEPSTGNAG